MGSRLSILRQVHVNVPFFLLKERYLRYCIDNKINPEIGWDAAALDGAPTDPMVPRIAETLSAAGLSVTFHGPFVDLAPGSSDPDVRAVSRRRMAQVLALVPLFRPVSVVCHTGYEHKRHGYMQAQWNRNGLPLWRWFAGELASAGSQLVLENVFEHQPEDLLPLVRDLAAQGGGCCLDVGHQAAFSKASIERWLDVLGPCVRHLHLHDNNGDMDSHMALGRGGVDLERVFGFLASCNGDRPVLTLEPHVQEDLWPSLDFLVAHWPW